MQKERKEERKRGGGGEEKKDFVGILNFGIYKFCLAIPLVKLDHVLRCCETMDGKKKRKIVKLSGKGNVCVCV